MAAYPSQALVINLDRRPDRWERVERHLETSGLAKTTAIRRVAAVDGKELPPGVVERVVNLAASGDDAYLSASAPGAAGCWLSHLACWEEVAASLDPPDAPCSVLEAVGTQAPVIASAPESPPSSSCSSCSSSSLVVSAPPTDGSEWVGSPAPPNITLILEDDVLFLPDFASHLSSAVEAMVEAGLDVCLVGWSALRRRDGSVARFTGTHAYLLTPEGARTLLARAAASLPVTLAIDWQLGYWSASGDLALETAPRLLAVQARAYTDTDIRGSAVGDDEEPGLARLKPPTAAMLADLSSEIDVLGRGIAGALSGYDAVPPDTAGLRWGIDLVDRLREVVGFLVATPPAETEVRVLT